MVSSHLTPAFIAELERVAGRLGMDPVHLFTLMHFETGGSFAPDQLNAAGSGATGLIQFMPSTAKSLGTTTADLAQMTAVQQLAYVEQYMNQWRSRGLGTLGNAYLAVLYPAAMSMELDEAVFRRGTKAYTQNAGLDVNRDGIVTKSEIVEKIYQRMYSTEDLWSQWWGRPEDFDPSARRTSTTRRYQATADEDYRPVAATAPAETIPLTNSESILAILGVLSPTDEATPLASLPSPKEGEIDIGDLRFGSDLETAIDPSHLNQPTALVQQNVGSVGLVDMLRTDMSVVIGDNRTLPEVTITIALNATTRDDVNQVLRPLIAMQRRLPFTVARSGDLARLMLGLGVTSDNLALLKQYYPTRSNEELSQLAEALIDREPADIWIPVTIRKVVVQNRPGAPDFYDVHVVLRFANTLPYVPAVRFWKRTDDAVTWARYLSVRGQQGTELMSLAGDGAATVLLADGKQVSITSPDLASAQTDDPHRSYVFKRFYRGLLEEYQYVYDRDDATTSRGPLGLAGQSWTDIATRAVTREDYVYLPGYPITDPERLFERYKPTTSIGLEFVNTSTRNTREFRMARIVQTFERRNQYLQLIQNVASTYGTASSDEPSLKELQQWGKHSPITLAPFRDFQTIGYAIETLSSLADPLYRDIERSVAKAKNPALTTLRTWVYSDGKVDERSTEVLSTFRPEAYAAGIVRQADAAYRDGVMDFFVSPGFRKERYVMLSDEMKRWQYAMLTEYATVLHRLETSNAEYRTWLGTRQAAFASELRAHNAKATNAQIDTAFGAYMLSYDFTHGENGLLTQPWLATTPQGAALQKLVLASAELQKTLLDTVASEQASVVELLSGGASSTTMYMPLQLSALEQITLEFTNRYGDRDWDGYPQPVTQHIGGGNATLVLEFTTNDTLLLDQLGAIRQAQMALGELRKTRDVVPPLVTIHEAGCLPRSLGIRQLAYRSHQVVMAENRPGYYQVRLDLIQDEHTLVRHEHLTHVAATTEQLFQMDVSRPLMVPAWTTIGESGLQYDAPLTTDDWLRALVGMPATRQTLGWTAESRPASRTELKPVTSIRLAYRPKADRTDNAPAFDVTVLREGEQIRLPINLDPLLGPTISFLDFAKGTLTAQEFDWIAGQIEIALSSDSGAGGALLSMATLSSQLHEYESAGASAQVFGPYEMWVREHDHRQPAILVYNLTRLVDVILNPGDDTPELRFAVLAQSLRQSADQVSRALVANDKIREVYKEWVASLVPPDGYDFSTVVTSADRLAEQRNLIGQRIPSCYLDLMMPELRDTVTGVNILGYDFPFGPGASDFGEDQYLRDYTFAENLAGLLQLQTASIGADVLPEYLTFEGEELSETGRQFRNAFNAVADNIATTLASTGNQNAWPFSTDTGSKNYFSPALQWLKDETSSFNVDERRLRRPLTKENWGNLIRLGETLKYVALIIETGKQLAKVEGLSQDATDDLRDFYRMLESNAFDAAQAARHLSTISSVQLDYSVIRQRDRLIGLYSQSATEVAASMGYTDWGSIAQRTDLRAKLNESWSGKTGMRRAFPSYMMLLVSRVGSAFFTHLGDMYTYSAIQSLEIRNQAESAGQTCDLLVSNMRWRLASDYERSRTIVFDYERDLSMSIRPGSHMHVYLGYGPDVAHLYPFAGRVVEFQPGPVTQIQLASYSSTLNNPPVDGQGFFVDGADAQQTLEQAILFTISNTSGLEGLGRGLATGALDSLERTERGSAEDDFRTGLAVSVYSALGKPGLRTMFRNEGQAESVSNLVDLVARNGVGSVTDAALGHPRLYENVWVIGGSERYGWSDMILGTIPNWVRFGNTWGWVALPDETCWAQLNDQALLFPDYVVTTRPYNIGVPLADQAAHGLRQTLYFGPQHGRYIFTSSTAQSSRPWAHLMQEQSRDILAAVFAGDEGGTRLRELYETVFVTAVVAAIRKLLEETSTAMQDFSKWIMQGLGTMITVGLKAVTPGAGNSVADPFIGSGPVRNVYLSDEQADLLRLMLVPVFENTAPLLMQNVAERGTLSLRYIETAEQALEEPQTDLGKALLEAFARDLLTIAYDTAVAANMNTLDSDANQVLRELQTQLTARGYRPNSRTKPLVTHRQANTYTSVINNNIIAAGGRRGPDPDFANKITLTWPTDPDKRLDAMMGMPGKAHSYTIQAHPTLDSEAIVEKTVYYPNLRINLWDAAAQYADSFTRAEERAGGGVTFNELLQYQADLYEKLEDGESDVAARSWMGLGQGSRRVKIQEAIRLSEQRLYAIIENLDSNIRPKFQVVAGNLLKQALTYMYQGTLTLHGDPTIQTYDILHLWDDGKQMHGPVQVGGVYHSFTSDGFYTIVQPRLVNSLRGIDPSLDTTFLDFAFWFNNWHIFLSRLGAGAVGAVGWGLRAGMWIQLTNWMKIPYVGAIAATVDLLYNILAGLHEAGQESLRRYIGVMATVVDANPVVILPLTQRMQAFVAGLDGATGPGALSTAMLDAINQQQEQGHGITDWITLLRNHSGRIGLQ